MTTLLPDYFNQYSARYQPYKDGAWCYEDGCIYRGLQLLAEATPEPCWLAHLHRLADAQISPQGGLRGYDPENFNIDNILSGRVLFGMAQRSGDPRYLHAARQLMAQLDRHPRIPAGNYWHKLRYPHQVWLDGLYMALPFQIEFALATNERDRITDALQQFSMALTLTEAPGGLQVHGYDDSRRQAWADPISGKSPAVWARAMGWLVMALVDALALLPQDATTEALREKLAVLLAALVARQEASGLWCQVLDAPDLVGNYEESSASAMFAYALLRATRLGLAPDPALRHAGHRALAAVQGRVGPNGFEGICHVAGLGPMGAKTRDGSPAYYLTEAIVSDDPKGVGPLMMAWAEAQMAP